MSRSAPISLSTLGVVTTAHALASLTITGVCADSRQVQPGDLFFARSGGQHRGVDYIRQAAERGAVAAVLDQRDEALLADVDCPIPVVSVAELSQQMGKLAAQFYGHPSRQLTVIGITGTNGKTSCAHYMAQALNQLGRKTAVIGTVGNGFAGALEPASHTTPDAISLQALLARLLAQGATAVVMEVSSHAIAQQRIAGVAFRVVAMTNLSRDHLDYHGTLAAYANTKAQLFYHTPAAARVLNLDDPTSAALYTQLHSAGLPAIGCSLQQAADLSAEQFQLSAQGLQMTLRWQDQPIQINSGVIGAFNGANLLLCAAMLLALDYPPARVGRALSDVQPVPGRMQVLHRPAQPLVVVDYAHTPDALEKALLAAKAHCRGDLWLIFGCGGDRDTGKRAQMGAVAERLSDQIILTSDNPRSEAPEAIIQMIRQGVTHPEQVGIQPDRQQAIVHALQHARSDDLVLIAGKGHEDYQEIKGVKYPFSDQQTVNDYWQGVMS